MHETAVGALAGNHGLPRVAASEQAARQIEPQARLASLRAMTRPAVLGEQRFDVASEIDRAIRGRRQFSGSRGRRADRHLSGDGDYSAGEHTPCKCPGPNVTTNVPGWPDVRILKAK